MLFDTRENTEIYRLNAKIKALTSKGALIEVVEKNNSRTTKQNASIHLYCEMIAETLNDLGHTFEYTGIKGVKMELRYTMLLVKTTLWKPIQMALFEKESTTELTTKEVSEVAEHIERYFATIGLDLPFPHVEK